MTEKIPIQLTEPEILRQIRVDLISAWLKPFSAYLEKHGFELPDCGISAKGSAPSSAAIDYEYLARVFMEPGNDMPELLAESIFLIHSMANPAGMEIILQETEDAGIDLQLGDEVTPTEVAVGLWLREPRLLENLHNCLELTQARAFHYYSSNQPLNPEYCGPTADQLAQLEQRLNAFFVAWKRGPGARVFAYSHPLHPRVAGRRSLTLCQCTTPAEWWFLVRHGAPYRREAALENGQPASVCFRPQRHDVLVFDPSRGEMRIHCCTLRERKILLRLFGRCLFGRNDYFPVSAKYSLAPLVRRGRNCLACADVPGLEKVNLTEVEFYFQQEPWKRVIQKANDIFALVERAELQWPDRLEQITRATFEVKFRWARKPRRVTIVPCNKALYGRDDDSSILEKWMEAREFVVG